MLKRTKVNEVKAFAEAQIDSDTGIISGVSVITEGEARGHGILVDLETLKQIRDCAKEFRDGVKVKINHGTGFDSIIGTLKNFRIERPQLLADLHLLKSHERYGHVLEIARTMPNNIGLSVVFSGVHEEIEDQIFARCAELYSTDLVDTPAANPNGLFEAPIDSSKEHDMKDKQEFAEAASENKVADFFKMLRSLLGLQDDEEKPEDEPSDEPEKKPDEDEEMSQNEPASLEVLQASLDELRIKLSKRDEALNQLASKFEEALEAKEQEVEKRANIKAMQLLQKVGGAPRKEPGKPHSGKPLIDQYAEIEDPLEKGRFFEKHREDLMRLN